MYIRDELLNFGDFVENAGNGEKRLVLEVRLLFKLLPATQWVDIAVVAVVFGLLMKFVNISSLMIWAAVVLVIISFRIGIAERYSHSVVTEKNVDAWLNLFLICATLYGTMWSLTAILLVPSEIPTFAAFTALILCALTAAEAAMSSVNLKAFSIYVISTLWPYSFFLITANQYPQLLIGATSFLFSFIVFIMGLRVNNFFKNMVDMELKNGRLYEELRYEVKKRSLAENALLDNTLDEELAEKIRQQSLLLKEGRLKVKDKIEAVEREQADNLRLLDRKFQHQIENALVIINELEQENLSDGVAKDIKILEKLLSNVSHSFQKATTEGEHVRQELLEIDYGEKVNSQIHLRRMINYLVQAIPLVYKAKFITVNKDIDKDIPAHMYGNKEALNKILFNLLTNAVKYSDGGVVNITVKRLQDTDGSINLKFTIEDSGIGMTSGVVDFINNENEENMAAFPGLTLVKYLVSKNASKLVVSSTPGVGTRVEFEMAFAAVSTLEA